MQVSGFFKHQTLGQFIQRSNGFVSVFAIAVTQRATIIDVTTNVISIATINAFYLLSKRL